MVKDIFHFILAIVMIIALITTLLLGFIIIIVLVMIDTFINFVRNTNFLDIYRKDKRGK
tara:strand:+ start:2289 stop:2465 length:177 start_codon:yes stop_codon:yes gene_type:complete